MAWPNPFRRRTPNTRTCWGYTFELTSDHLTEKESFPLKHSYDKLAEDCLAILDEISPPPSHGHLPRNDSNRGKSSETNLQTSNSPNTPNPPPTATREATKDVAVLQTPSNPPPPSRSEPSKDASAEPNSPSSTATTPPRDLFALLRDNHKQYSKLDQLWTELTTVPDWVDWAQIRRGQDVFYRYGGAALTGLAYQSLLGGMGAARVVETLARTGGFSTKVSRRRLLETTQHILQCTRSLEALQPPEGEGFASTVRVRFLHAAVRRRIMKLEKERPGYYSVEENGIPINDLDSIGTIATFSSTLIWLSFPRQGIYLREQEITDYMALWRYIGYLVGCPTDPYFTNPTKAKACMESLLLNEIHPTETSKILALNVIKSLDDQPPGYASADMLTANARWLNGEDLCNELALPHPSIYYYILVIGQCLFFMGLCYFYRSFESLDRRKVETLKKVFWQIVVGSKYGLEGKETAFEFKYIPEFSTVTEMSDGNEVREKQRGVEWRNLKAFLMGVGVMGGVGWVSWKTFVGVWGLGRSLVGLIWR